MMVILKSLLVVVLSASSDCQGPVAVEKNDPLAAQGYAAGLAVIQGIDVAPQNPGWFSRLALKVRLAMCLNNFQKMLRAGKVFTGDPRAQGATAFTTPEAAPGGRNATWTSGVGVGGEQIHLGPQVLHPNLHPVERGQKFIHEGARVKQRIEISAAVNANGGGGPLPQAPDEQRCRWLKNEQEIYKADADYFDALADSVAAGGGAANVIATLRAAAQQRRDKAAALLKEMQQNC